MQPIIFVPFEAPDPAAFEQTAAGSGYSLCFGGDCPNKERVVAVIGNLPPQTLSQYPSLRWVQLQSAGADAYTQPGVLPAGTVLTNATGAYGLAIAEYMTAGVLMLLKKLHLYRDCQSQGAWQSLGEVGSVWGSRVLCVGMGDIGGEFARRMHALGARVTGIRRTAAPPPDYLEALYTLEQLDEQLPGMDVVALSLPNTPQTKGLFCAGRLARMKPGAILLNVGRGTAVDTEALLAALESGHLGGAVLDVTEPEPLPPDHPLWQQPNVILTPHVAGGFSLPQTQLRIAAICLDNLGRFLAGQSLQNQVDFSTGYRRNA